MSVSFRYWDDCSDPEDIDAMWKNPEVSTEWNNAGEAKGQKIHLSRDPDGQPYLTQTETRAVVGIIIQRHFDSQIDLDMVCAIAELESDRQPLATRYNRRTKETSIGIMQIFPKIADWLVREAGYRTYDVIGNPELLFWPFVSIYFGAAYLKWLSNFDQKERSEEFIVRAYKGGTKKATHKSTLQFWQRYLAVKQSLPSRKIFEDGPSLQDSSVSRLAVSQNSGAELTYWDSRTSPEDMEEMWNRPDVVIEWTRTGEKHGKVRFSHDLEKRPYLSRVELKGVAELVLSKHFSSRGAKPSVLCALAEVVSMRFVNGVGSRPGIMGIDYPTASWLYRDLGYKAYRVESVEDLTKPFVSMYFGVAYIAWLSMYEGRERTPQFIVQAYLAGPQNVNFQETGPLWLKFEAAISNYENTKSDEQGSCSIL
ncbi:Transglycosylase SLT domain 1 [Dillenia turbinata]|uniref:Transglycosylase SLT domain 1 n=1 Tax=Dillenia turbinata TaxID=194707 RepID=A0AAN8ZVZ3_9MAGN